MVVLAIGCAAPSETRTTSAPAEPPPSSFLCGPGTRPDVSSAACEPVGPREVPPGFAAGEWGFHAVRPAALCANATIATLGESSCQPLDPCSAPFPAGDASVIVRGKAAPHPERPDLRAVATIAEAIAISEPGATIAVDEGEFLLPEAITKGVRFVGRCAERTALRGAAFGAKVESKIQVDFSSLSFVGAPKVALLANRGARVSVDRVWFHGDNDGAVVGNGAWLRATRSIFEGSSESRNPNAAMTGIQASYGGRVELEGVEFRAYQLAIMAQSVGTEVSVSKSILHEQRTVGIELEAASMLGAFGGARLTLDGSLVEAGRGRIGIVGAERLDGRKDPTSPGDPPASLRVTRSALVQAGARRETGSALDLVSGASVEIDDVTIVHDSLIGIASSEGATATLKNAVILSEPSVTPRVGIAATRRGTVALDSTAILGSRQFAIVLDSGSRAAIARSLVSGNREVESVDVTAFMGAAQAITVAPRGHATIVDSALLGNEGSAVFLQGSSAEIERTVLAATSASKYGAYTAAVTAIDAALTIRQASFVRNDRALAFRYGRALLRDSIVTDSREALRLDGVSLLETAEHVEDAADQTVMAVRTTFARNAILASSKALTLE